MQRGDIERYCLMMVEVKLRLATLDATLAPPRHPIHPDAYLEFAYLQIRKVLELVALGSLVSNRAAYSVAYSNFEKARDARLILRDLERVNPNFYPVPGTLVANPEPGVNWHVAGPSKPYLTKSKFLALYERCGSVLHTQNPAKPRSNAGKLLTDISIHRSLIEALLEVHTIQLAKDSNRYLVQMHAPDGLVHHFSLSPRRDQA